MNESFRKVLHDVGENVIAYLPSLVAGVLLVAVGLVLAWLAKRVAIRLFAIFRLDSMFLSSRWGRELSKGDIRHAFYNLAGNVIYVLVLLVFLYAALEAMQLAFLSRLVQEGVSLIPKILIALFIVGLGWWVARQVSTEIRKTLIKEEIPRAALIAGYARFVLVAFACSLALVEINIAPTIVLVGFGAFIVTMGALAVISAWTWSHGFHEKGRAQPDTRREPSARDLPAPGQEKSTDGRPA